MKSSKLIILWVGIRAGAGKKVKLAIWGVLFSIEEYMHMRSCFPFIFDHTKSRGSVFLFSMNIKGENDLNLKGVSDKMGPTEPNFLLHVPMMRGGNCGLWGRKLPGIEIFCRQIHSVANQILCRLI